jgi:hypothetical protein
MDLFAGLVFFSSKLASSHPSLHLPVSSAFRRSNVFILNIPYTTTPATSDGTTFTLTNQTDPLTLHDHAVLTFPTQLVHNHPGVSGSTLSFPSFQVDDQNARVVRIDMGGEIVPTVRRRAIGMDQRKLVRFKEER